MFDKNNRTREYDTVHTPWLSRPRARWHRARGQRPSLRDGRRRRVGDLWYARDWRRLGAAAGAGLLRLQPAGETASNDKKEQEDPIYTLLKSVSADELTPRDALELIYRLKAALDV